LGFDSKRDIASFSPGADARTITGPGVLVMRTRLVAMPASARTGFANIFSVPNGIAPAGIQIADDGVAHLDFDDGFERRDEASDDMD
jgi:streptogramin lyase